jgi:hypothetical protein
MLLFAGFIACGAWTVASAAPAWDISTGQAPWLRIGFALIICVVAALVAALLLRARFPAITASQIGSASRSINQAIQILEVKRLSMSSEICRVVWRRKEYLILVNTGGSSVLVDTLVVDASMPHADRSGEGE